LDRGGEVRVQASSCAVTEKEKSGKWWRQNRQSFARQRGGKFRAGRTLHCPADIFLIDIDLHILDAGPRNIGCHAGREPWIDRQISAGRS
jgi:hypothetical protein